MTADRRAALVKAVCDAMHEADPFYVSYDQAIAAISLIRADVLEEAARELDRRGFKELADTAIRALKEKP